MRTVLHFDSFDLMVVFVHDVVADFLDLRGFPRLLGMYEGGAFEFSFVINTNYPHEPPKVKCIPKVRCSVQHLSKRGADHVFHFIRFTTPMSILKAMSA